MSEGARIASKRQTTSGEEREPKRMKTESPPRAPASADSFEGRLRGVISFRAAIPPIDEYLSSIQIGDDDPAFLFDWQADNVNAFVAAANGLNAAQAPPWLRTRPPHMTASSFIDDVVYRLQPPLAGGRFGNIMLAPNNQQQYGAILLTLGALQNDAFLQNAMHQALPVVDIVERYLAVTAHITDTRARNAIPNELPPSLQNGHPLPRLFF